MYQLTTEHSFDSAHFLAGYQGKCGNLHGHRWRVLLTVESESLREDPQQRGMCVDFAHLKQDLREELDRLDHVLIIEEKTLKPNTMKAYRKRDFRWWRCHFVLQLKILLPIFTSCIQVRVIL